MSGTAFFELPADAFPFTLEYLHAETRKVLYTITCSGPGSLEVPGHNGWGAPVAIRITYANGKVEVDEPKEGEE